MQEVVLEIENISKQYRLGLVGTGTISHDLNRFWHRLRKKNDPYLKIGDLNDRSNSGADYVWALKDISFSVREGEVVGIIGKNGAGKSTLLKLLSQVTNPSSGEIRVNGRIASLLEVGTGFHPELTGRENVFLNGAILGMTKIEIKSKLKEIIEFSGCSKYIDTPVKRYSSGMLVRLGFAVAAYLEPEILVVDEVLAVGDLEFQKKCIGKMREVSKSGRTVLFVSHNMASIKELCSRVIILEDGYVKFNGDVIEGVNNYISSNLSSNSISNNIISSKELDFVKLELKNSKKELSKLFFYDEMFFVDIDLSSDVNYDFSIIDISIGTEFEKILYISTYEFYEGFLKIKKGINSFSVSISNNLLPGIYYVNLGCHVKEVGGFKTKVLADYCFKFEISNSSINGEKNYPFSMNFGHVNGEATWNKNNL